MTQDTGTQILSRARLFSQDDDGAGNYAVSDTKALTLLNDILLTLNNNVAVKPKWVNAATSGLTFTSGTASKLTTGDVGATEIESFHQSNAATITFPPSSAIERVSVQEILEMFDYDGNTALAASAAEWTHVAAEKSQTDTSAGVEVWRVYAFPVINTTRYIHLRVPAPVQITALTQTPDLDPADSRIASRLLAFEMARLKKDMSPEFLNNIVRLVPQDILDMRYGGAVRASQLQDHIIQRND